jgi:hypothetical protein
MRDIDVIRNNERIINQQFGKNTLRSRGVSALKRCGSFLALGSAILFGIGVTIEQAVQFIKQTKNKQ